MSDHPPFHEVSICIEQDGTNRYKFRAINSKKLAPNSVGAESFRFFTPLFYLSLSVSPQSFSALSSSLSAGPTRSE
jgi:hypothetical protein